LSFDDINLLAPERRKEGEKMGHTDGRLDRLNKLLRDGDGRVSAWAGVIVYDDDKVLLVFDGSKGENGMWCIPGGGYEHDDGLLRMTAAREAFQEAGVFVDLDRLPLVYVDEVADQERNGGVHVKCFFSCSIRDVIATSPSYNSREILGVEWFGVMVKDGDVYIFTTDGGEVFPAHEILPDSHVKALFAFLSGTRK
jgi:ADP-ribose pyrophosphatase YjhB (NUDIX family)